MGGGEGMFGPDGATISLLKDSQDRMNGASAMGNDGIMRRFHVASPANSIPVIDEFVSQTTFSENDQQSLTVVFRIMIRRQDFVLPRIELGFSGGGKQANYYIDTISGIHLERPQITMTWGDIGAKGDKLHGATGYLDSASLASTIDLSLPFHPDLIQTLQKGKYFAPVFEQESPAYAAARANVLQTFGLRGDEPLNVIVQTITQASPPNQPSATKIFIKGALAGVSGWALRTICASPLVLEVPVTAYCLGLGVLLGISYLVWLETLEKTGALLDPGIGQGGGSIGGPGSAAGGGSEGGGGEGHLPREE